MYINSASCHDEETMQKWLKNHHLTLFANSEHLDPEKLAEEMDGDIYKKEITTLFKATLGLQSQPGSSSYVN